MRGERSLAAQYYRANLGRLDAEGAAGSDTVEALQDLADMAKVCTERTWAPPADCVHHHLWTRALQGQTGAFTMGRGSTAARALLPCVY